MVVGGIVAVALSCLLGGGVFVLGASIGALESRSSSSPAITAPKPDDPRLVGCWSLSDVPVVQWVAAYDRFNPDGSYAHVGTRGAVRSRRAVMYDHPPERWVGTWSATPADGRETINVTALERSDQPTIGSDGARQHHTTAFAADGSMTLTRAGDDERPRTFYPITCPGG